MFVSLVAHWSVILHQSVWTIGQLSCISQFGQLVSYLALVSLDNWSVILHQSVWPIGQLSCISQFGQLVSYLASVSLANWSVILHQSVWPIGQLSCISQFGQLVSYYVALYFTKYQGINDILSWVLFVLAEVKQMPCHLLSVSKWQLALSGVTYIPINEDILCCLLLVMHTYGLPVNYDVQFFFIYILIICIIGGDLYKIYYVCVIGGLSQIAF